MGPVHSPASPKPEVLLVKMKLTVTVLSLLLVGTALANPFDDQCAACCINTPTPIPEITTTTTTPEGSTPTPTTASSTTDTASTTTTTASTTTDATQNDEAKESTTTTPALQTCDQIFEEGCKCDTDGAAHQIVS